MHETEVEDFLAHYGVKGMKWGVRRDRSNRRGGSDSSKSSGSSVEKPKRKIDKKKVAMAAGIVGGAAALTIAAVVVSKQHSAGKLSVTDQMKKMGGDSTWDVLKNVQTTPPNAPKPKPPKPTRAEMDARVEALKRKAGEDAVRQQMKEFSQKSMWDIMNEPAKPAPAPAAPAASRSGGFKTPAQKRREGEERAKEQIKSFASKSMWEIAADPTLQPKQPKKSTYSNLAKKQDVKMYGEKNAARIAKQVKKGVPLSEARQQAAIRTFGPTAARVATNIGTAKINERIRR